MPMGPALVDGDVFFVICDQRLLLNRSVSSIICLIMSESFLEMHHFLINKSVVQSMFFFKGFFIRRFILIQPSSFSKNTG